MDLSIRDWMLVIGVLMLLAVALDGYRRASRERKTQVRLSRNAKRIQTAGMADQDGFPSELPNGGARVVGIIEGPDIDPTNPPDIPSERIPVKIKPDPRVEAILNKPEQRHEPTLGNELPAVAEIDEDPLFATRDGKGRSRQKGRDKIERQKPEVEVRQPSLFEDPLPDTHERAQEDPEEIIALHVLARDSEGFAGEDLMHILLACDCRFGEMNIFHRYEAENAKGEIQFSIVNLVEPGVFNLEDIKSFRTPGVSFFMRLPGPQDPMMAFNAMVETSQCLVRNLNGELKDSSRSTVTQQTLEHTRERIREFLKRRMMNS